MAHRRVLTASIYPISSIVDGEMPTLDVNSPQFSTHPGMRCGCVSGKLSGIGGIKGKQMVTEVFKKPDSHQGVYNLGVFFTLTPLVMVIITSQSRKKSFESPVR